MEIRIHLPRPLLTLGIVVGVVLWWNGVIVLRLPGGSSDSSGIGGQQTAALITDAIRDIDRQRVTQAVVEKQEEILRYQLQALEEDALQENSPEKIEEIAKTREVLLSLIKQRTNSEKLLRLSLEQMWEAEGTAYSTKIPTIAGELDWPVVPALGLSAFFEDAGYKARFGVDHHAVDIPTPQGTPIRAPADGAVAKVSLNGLGYSFVVLEHEGGLQTIYGHVTDAVVQQGDSVIFGQVIGHTGGTPGTQGAGFLTTGPHLHFAVRVDGALVDPMQYLPKFQDPRTKIQNE